MSKSPGFRNRCGWMVAAVMALSGCAGRPAALAPRFYGVWVNTDAGMHSWLQIEAHRMVSFGLFQSNGHCVASDIDILANDRLSVPVSSLGSGDMSMRLNGGALVVAGKNATQRFMPTSRESICQVGGKYLPGAPYPKQGS